MGVPSLVRFVGGNRQHYSEIIHESTIPADRPVKFWHAEHGTAASRGRGDVFQAGELHQVVTGWSPQGPLVGDTGARVPPRVVSDRNAGDLHLELAVTGLAGGRNDIGKIVYITAHSTLSLVRTARSVPVGWIVEPRTASKAIVALWDGHMLSQFAMVRETATLGLLGTLGTDTTITCLSWPVPYRAKLTSVQALCVVAPTGADAAGSLTFRRNPLGTGANHVAVTGGAIALETGDAADAVVAGAAITATNNVHEGDVLEGRFAITDAGTFTAGLYLIRGVFDMILGT